MEKMDWSKLVGKKVVSVEKNNHYFGSSILIKFSGGYELSIGSGDGGTMRDPEPYFNYDLKKVD